MQRVCTRCDRISLDGNLWCQEAKCPAGAMSVLLGYGDYLGDLEVVRLVCVVGNATIYEARRGETKVLLKVAHDGSQEQLKREAAVLAKLSGQHPMLPVLLPPYPNVESQQRPYGKINFRDETKYYEVFEYVEGEFLRDMLLKNPQPWYLHAAWITTSIADALAFLNVKGGKLHLNLNPDVIYVRLDREGIPRPILMDLGAVADAQNVDWTWLVRFAIAAYTAPETLERRGAPGVTADVYGLGLVLYEMLAGAPAFAYRQQREDDVRAAVLRQPPPRLNRADLSEDLVQVLDQALDKSPARRQPDVRALAKQLRAKFGEVPPEKKGRSINRRIVAGIVAAMVIIMGLILLAGALGT